jgi:hypothetical protein
MLTPPRLPVLLAADPIQNQTPDGTGLPGHGALDTIMGWLMYGSLTCCAIAVIAAGGMVAVGNLSARPHMAERGKSALVWSLGGAVLVGLAVALVNGFFGLGSK